jgi:hypothetical protein
VTAVPKIEGGDVYPMEGPGLGACPRIEILLDNKI